MKKEDFKKLRFNGKRIKRGLFIDQKLNKVFNADLNGALNLVIKKLGRKTREEFLRLRNWLDKLARAVKVSPEFPLNAGIGGSISYPLKGVAKDTFVSRRYHF